MRSGDEVEIEYVRDNDKRKTSTELGQQRATASVGAEIHPGLVGAQFTESSTTRDGGVEVAAVEPGSPAAQRGLRAGDIITAVNRRPVRSLAELNEIASTSRILFLLVQRGDRALMLQIR
jgi:S1-C subfamily serine protease